MNWVTHAQLSLNPQPCGWARLGRQPPCRDVGLGAATKPHRRPDAVWIRLRFSLSASQRPARLARTGHAEEHPVSEAAAHGTTLDLYWQTLRQNFHTRKANQTNAEATAVDRL
jgi:hypothetical protein